MNSELVKLLNPNRRRLNMEDLPNYKHTPSENANNISSTFMFLSSSGSRKRLLLRALIAYWILGLCNNYGYVVMLSAASDIIADNEPASSEMGSLPVTESLKRNCTYMSTGAILLADIIPSLLIKAIAPFLPFYVNVRITLCVSLSAIGFVLVAFGNSIEISIMGVVMTSLCSGLGEITYLQYSSYYEKNVISAWSSGTGAAGVIGALSYALLQQLGFRETMLIMLIIPVLTALTFWIILPKPFAMINAVEETVNNEEVNNPKTTLIKKFQQIPSLMKYMIPLGSVYMFEYFINQGTFELIDFDNTFLDQHQQYRWLQVVYQIGVFLSRSSVNLFVIHRIWLMSVFQLINVAIFTSEVILFYIPSFWIIVAATLWEGFLGGAAYVNTYYRISTEVEREKKQFALAITGLADSIGITIAGFVAMIAHNAICSLPRK